MKLSFIKEKYNSYLENNLIKEDEVRLDNLRKFIAKLENELPNSEAELTSQHLFELVNIILDDFNQYPMDKLWVLKVHPIIDNLGIDRKNVEIAEASKLLSDLACHEDFGVHDNISEMVNIANYLYKKVQFTKDHFDCLLEIKNKLEAIKQIKDLMLYFDKWPDANNKIFGLNAFKLYCENTNNIFLHKFNVLAFFKSDFSDTVLVKIMFKYIKNYNLISNDLATINKTRNHHGLDSLNEDEIAIIVRHADDFAAVKAVINTFLLKALVGNLLSKDDYKAVIENPKETFVSSLKKVFKGQAVMGRSPAFIISACWAYANANESLAVYFKEIKDNAKQSLLAALQSNKISDCYHEALLCAIDILYKNDALTYDSLQIMLSEIYHEAVLNSMLALYSIQKLNFNILQTIFKFPENAVLVATKEGGNFSKENDFGKKLESMQVNVRKAYKTLLFCGKHNWCLSKTPVDILKIITFKTEENLVGDATKDQLLLKTLKLT